MLAERPGKRRGRGRGRGDLGLRLRRRRLAVALARNAARLRLRRQADVFDSSRARCWRNRLATRAEQRRQRRTQGLGPGELDLLARARRRLGSVARTRSDPGDSGIRRGSRQARQEPQGVLGVAPCLRWLRRIDGRGRERLGRLGRQQLAQIVVGCRRPGCAVQARGKLAGRQAGTVGCWCAIGRRRCRLRICAARPCPGRRAARAWRAGGSSARLLRIDARISSRLLAAARIGVAHTAPLLSRHPCGPGPPDLVRATFAFATPAPAPL